jgi:hypothetical protein
MSPQSGPPAGCDETGAELEVEQEVLRRRSAQSCAPMRNARSELTMTERVYFVGATRINAPEQVRKVRVLEPFELFDALIRAD